MNLSLCCPRGWWIPLSAAVLFAVVPPAPAADAPIRVLIFSGQNNHDWKTTTPKLKSILAQSGRFAVEVTEQPEQSTAETLSAYDLIVGNWNVWGDAKVKTWPPALREAFLEFIRGGKGYLTIHAGSSSFYDWPDYQQIGGMFWDLPATSHGPPHEFTVQFPIDHPVTRGLAPFKTKDELWLKPGVHPAAQVLATADNQPLAVATALGKGRGFALLLGHSAEFMDTLGFQTLLLRGAEWAATGQVTLRGPNDAHALNPDAVIQRVAKQRFGSDRTAVLALERLVQAASVDPSQRSQLAARLAAALTAEGSIEGKRSLIEGLSLLGSAAEVPVLARTLADTNLFDHARQALERIPGVEAENALQASLVAATGRARASLILSLAARRAESALPAIAKYLADPDPDVAGAAIDALGTLGGAQAASALQAAITRIAPGLRVRLSAALLRVAESLSASGNRAEAAALLARLVAPDQPAPIRLAAFPAHVTALGERGSAEVLAALTADDPIQRQAGVRALRESRDPALLRAAVEKLDSLPVGERESIVILCGERGDATHLPVLTRGAASSDPVVKRAAVQALGLLGNASTVSALAQLAESGSNEESKAIAEALTRLRGAEVDPAILFALKTAPPSSQRVLIRALADRQAQGAGPDLLIAAASDDPAVRQEAIRALGRLADARECPALVACLDHAAPSDHAALEGALAEIGRRDPSAVPVLVEALPRAPVPTQVVLVGALGSIGGQPAGAAIRAQLKSNSPEVRLAAVRVLAEWPDPDPLDDLAEVVETANDARIRALAARGVSRLAPQAPERADRLAEALARALAASPETATQKSLLSALVGIPCRPSLLAVQTQLRNPALAPAAAAGLLQIGEIIYPWHPNEVKTALTELQSTPPPAELAPRIAALATKLTRPPNFALGGFATSPDDLDKDGAAGGDQAAIDGDPATYWDEVDNRKLYRLRVQLRARSTVGCLRILGYAHHNFAPKDFEVRCDDQVVKTVSGAEYQDNWLTVEFPPTACTAIELKITGSHGPSPAIRELEAYGQTP